MAWGSSYCPGAVTHPALTLHAQRAAPVTWYLGRTPCFGEARATCASRIKQAAFCLQQL